MGEVASLIEAHAEHGVAGLEQGEVGRHVGLGAAVGLHVGVLCAVELLRAVDGELLADVDELAAAVVALPGVAFSVLVGQRRAEHLQNRPARVVLRRDEDDVAALPVDLRSSAWAISGSLSFSIVEIKGGSSL